LAAAVVDGDVEVRLGSLQMFVAKGRRVKNLPQVSLYRKILTFAFSRGLGTTSFFSVSKTYGIRIAQLQTHLSGKS
jgi:hypothetical protein